MAENMIKFLRGNVASLPQTATAGAVYFTKDEGLYLGLEDGSYHRYGDFITVADVASLPAAGAHETCMYYCELENVLAKWDGSAWVQINKQKTLSELGGVAKSVYEAKMAALEKADSDNATAISGIDTRLQTVETAIGENGTVTKAIADAQAQADKGVADAAAALAKANEKTTMAEVEAKKYATQDEAKGYADAKDEAIAAAKKAGDDAAAAAGVADGKADAAQAAADKAQDEVDALETLVGVLPEGTTATTVIEYVNKKTEGIATDAALGELNGQVSGLQTAVQGIQADYLKAADKTELSGKIDDAQADVDALAGKVGEVPADKTVVQMIADAQTAATYDDTKVKEDIAANAKAIADEKERAEGIEGGLETRLKAVEDDYLKAADKEALQNQINTIMNNPDAEGAINSINEFTKYVTDHGTIADGFRTDIDKNKEDIAGLKGIVGEAAEGENEATGLVKDVADNAAAIAAEKARAEGEEAKLAQADATNLQAAKDYADDAVEALGIADYVKKADADKDYAAAGHNHDDKYDAIGAAAKALEDAQAYADQAEADALSAAKSYTDELANGQVKTNTEAIATKAAQADLEAHTDNTTVHITADERTAWNAAEGNAKAYADGLKATIDAAYAAADATTLQSAKDYADQAEADAVATAKDYTDALANGAVATNTAAIATKANAADVYAKTETYTKSEVEAMLTWSNF